MKFILLNGAPGSGKDVAAKLLGAHITKHMANAVYHVKFADVLRVIAQIMTPHDLSDEDDYADFKTDIVPVINVTGRQLMIDIAEGFLKKHYGKDIMAKMSAEAVSEYANPDDIFIFSDCGFDLEPQHLAERFGEENVYVVNIKRDGYDYTNDSREDVTWSKSLELVNPGNLEDYNTEVGRLFGRLRNQKKYL